MRIHQNIHLWRIWFSPKIISKRQMLCCVPSMVFGWHSSKQLLKLMATKMWLFCMVSYNNIHNMRYQILSYQLICFATLGEWVYPLFMHRACLFENKEQYDKAGKILTLVLDNALKKSHITRFSVKVGREGTIPCILCPEKYSNDLWCHDNSRDARCQRPAAVLPLPLPPPLPLLPCCHRGCRAAALAHSRYVCARR